MIDSTTPEMPPGDFSTKDSILSHLLNQGLIGSYKQHTGFETQGLVIINQEMEPALNDIFADFKSHF